MAGAHVWKDSRGHTKGVDQSSLDIYVFPMVAHSVSMWIVMKVLRVGEFLWEYYASDPCILLGTRSESDDNNHCPIIIAFSCIFVHTFPLVLERLGIWCIEGPSSLGSKIPGDHGHFFEGDALRDCVAGCSESLTGTCMILVPRRVCVVVTSYISGFAPVSLIFGMAIIGYAVTVV